MTKKMKKQGGFTLVEMLIVVAIIAILIAVSIPLVSNALEKAKEATDAANERSFKAALTIAYLTDGKVDGADFVAGDVYVYDAVKGIVTKNAPNNPYGQSTSSGDCTEVAPEGQVLVGSVSTDGIVNMGWTKTDNISSVPANAKLVSTYIVKTTAPAAGG